MSSQQGTATILVETTAIDSDNTGIYVESLKVVRSEVDSGILKRKKKGGGVLCYCQNSGA